MAEVKKYGSTKRFGVRYGRKVKERFGKIESIQRKKQKCPYCAAMKAKRLAMGIWYCERCKAKFAGKAYSVTENIITKEVAPQEKKEAKEVA